MGPRILLALILGWTGGLAAWVPQAQAAKPPGKRYVDKKAGFRLQLPPGWRKLKSKEIRDPQLRSALAVFAPRDQRVTFVVQRQVSNVSPEQFLTTIQNVFKAIAFRKISEEVVVVSGLPARKLVFATPPKPEVEQMWMIFVLSKGEIWNLLVGGPERLFVLPEAARYQEVQQLVGSFEFLEPVLGRLKAGLAPSLTEAAIEQGASGQRYYMNDRLGIKILLPAQWQLVSEQPPSSSQPARVVLGQPGTLAQVILVREYLEASAELYQKLLEKFAIENTQDYRKISQDKVSRQGFQGTKRLFTTRERDIKFRYLAEIFSIDKQHFQIVAQAPEEVFDRYIGTFQEMMNSVEFLGLVSRLAATQVLPEEGGSQKQADLETVKRAVARDPDNFEARLALGEALGASGDIVGAISEFQAASRLVPDNALAHNKVGVAYEGKELYDEAIASYRRALELEPDFALAHFNLGDVYRKKGLYDEAIASYKRAIKLKLDNVDTYNNLGLAYEGKNLYKDAVKWYRKAAEQGYARAQTNLGVMYDQGRGVPEDDAEAVKWYRKAAEQGDARAQANMGFMYVTGRGVPEDDAEAVKWYRKATEQRYAWAYFDPDIPFSDNEQRLGNVIGDLETFLRHASQVRDHAFLTRGAYIQLANMYERMGREKDTLDKFEAALSGLPTDTFLLNEIAWRYATAKDLQLRHPQKALMYAKKAVGLDREPVPAHLDTLAEAYYVNGEFDKAIEIEKKALSLMPDSDFFKEQLKKFEEAKKAQVCQ